MAKRCRLPWYSLYGLLYSSSNRNICFGTCTIYPLTEISLVLSTFKLFLFSIEPFCEESTLELISIVVLDRVLTLSPNFLITSCAGLTMARCCSPEVLLKFSTYQKEKEVLLKLFHPDFYFLPTSSSDSIYSSEGCGFLNRKLNCGRSALEIWYILLNKDVHALWICSILLLIENNKGK